MKSVYTLTLLLLLSSSYSEVSAQDCGCDHTINNANNATLNVIDGADFDYQPGDVFCIPAGNYKSFRFENFKGSETSPLIFKNCDGLVEVRGESYSGIQFNSSQYIRLTGSGDENLPYGIHVSFAKSGASGVSVSNLSSDFEIDHVEISEAGFAGIVAKTDPKTTDCDSPETQATFRANFTLKNLDIHDNYIHDTGGEGMYIGPTWGYANTVAKDACNGFAHLLENVLIHDNILEQTGWDAIQVSLAHKNTRIYNNKINGYGYLAAIENEKNQSFGIAMGSGTRGEVYNNLVLQKPSNTTIIQRGISGINILTGTKVYNNVIVGSGNYGIWFHIRHVTNERLLDLEEDLGYYFMNNTIVNPGVNNTEGLGIYMSTCQPGNEGDAGCRYNFDIKILNNIVVNPMSTLDGAPGWMNLGDTFVQLVTKELRDSDNTNVSNNLFVRESPTQEQIDLGTTTLSDLDFSSSTSSSYTLGENSVAIDYGIDVSAYGITTDYNGGARPFGEGFDAGAFEFGATDQVPLAIGNNLTESNKIISAVYPNPSETGKINIDMNLFSGNQVQIELHSLTGSLLMRQSFSMSNIENNSVELDASLIAQRGLQVVVVVVKTEKEFSQQRLILGQ